MTARGADHVIVVVVTDSSSLTSVRESKSVDQASVSGSSQAGLQSSGPRGAVTSFEATFRTRQKIGRVESRWSDEEMR